MRDKNLFENLQDSLIEAKQYYKGKVTLKTHIIVEKPPEYKANKIIRLRKKMHLSQGLFAGICNVSPKTVQAWEQGLRNPTGAAKRLLEILEKKPGIVEETYIPKQVATG